MEMAATHYHCCSSLVLRSDSSLRLAQNLKLKNPKNSLLGTKIRVQPCSVSVNPAVSVFHRRPLAATVSFCLPISNPEPVSSVQEIPKNPEPVSSGQETPKNPEPVSSVQEIPKNPEPVSSVQEIPKNPESVSLGQEIPKWSASATKAIAMSRLEAKKLFRPTAGTESLLLGVLVEGTNPANKFLRANGITLFKVKDEMDKILGEANKFAIKSVHPQVTDDVQRALDWAVNNKLKSGEGGEITPTHILLGIWSEVDSLGHKILSNLGFNEEKAKELEASISKSVVIDK